MAAPGRATIRSRAKLANGPPLPSAPSASKGGLPSLLPLPGLKARPTQCEMQVQMKTTRDNAAGAAASRSTLGYARGRTASSVVHRSQNAATTASLPRSLSGASVGSDSTVTPARFFAHQQQQQQQQRQAGEGEVSRRLEFLSIFDPDVDEDDGLMGGDAVLGADELEDDFQFDVKF